jgi:hypothetical protein
MSKQLPKARCDLAWGKVMQFCVWKLLETQVPFVMSFPRLAHYRCTCGVGSQPAWWLGSEVYDFWRPCMVAMGKEMCYYDVIELPMSG